jgi:hypothetical protein
MVDGDLSDIEALAEIKAELHTKKDVSMWLVCVFDKRVVFDFVIIF